MTRYFEVLRRDGPARMGKLISEPQKSSPAVIGSDDYISAGSVYGYASIREAIGAGEALLEEKKLAILPYVPSALHSEPALELPDFETGGPKGVLVHPFSSREPQDADVYVLGNAAALKIPGIWLGQWSACGRGYARTLPSTPPPSPHQPTWHC